jgi:hypothetical protein
LHIDLAQIGFIGKHGSLLRVLNRSLGSFCHGLGPSPNLPPNQYNQSFVALNPP